MNYVIHYTIGEDATERRAVVSTRKNCSIPILKVLIDNELICESIRWYGCDGTEKITIHKIVEQSLEGKDQWQRLNRYWYDRKDYIKVPK